MRLPLEDTVVAISTPPGRGGIGVLRLSGNDSLKVALRLFRPRHPDRETGGAWSPEPRRVYLGSILSGQDGRVLDEACLTYFRSPKSYTCEDVVELSCHGSPRLLEVILESATRAGARPAAAGEFTLRAYLGGRIDVTQAEAVRDLIEAESEREIQLASEQLRGGVLELVSRLREEALNLIADAEAGLEFVEEAEEFPGRRQLLDRVSAMEGRIREAAASYRGGRRIREGVPVAILGPTNAGKSTLFNSLVGSSRAIVTADPGTTRDVISEMIEMEGIRIRLLDTAGLRVAVGLVEEEGVRRAREVAREADLVLFVMDLSGASIREEWKALGGLDREKVIPVLNKVDLAGGDTVPNLDLSGLSTAPVRISALRGDGLEPLRREIVSRIDVAPPIGNGGAMISNLRHRRLLDLAAEDLARSRESAANGASEEFLLVDLHGVLEHLGEITGEVPIEEVYDRIFSRFCIGK